MNAGAELVTLATLSMLSVPFMYRRPRAQVTHFQAMHT